MTERIAEYAVILNKFGIGSRQEIEFLELHKDEKELMELCKLAKLLKLALYNSP
jgi:hypothetical protein